MQLTGPPVKGMETHAGSYTIEFILHREKPKDIKSTCLIAVCDIRPQKSETHRKRLTEGVNPIDYPG